MTEFVKIPKKHFQALADIWKDITLDTVVDAAVDAHSGASTPDPVPPPVLENPLGNAPTIWIDPRAGHDSSDGMAPSSSVKSWNAVFRHLQPGMVIMLRPGIYDKPIGLANSGAHKRAPIYFKSEVPGEAIFDNMIDIGPGTWRVHGNGVFKRTNNVKDEGPWCGYSETHEKFIPRYKSLRDLTDARVNDVRMPKYGFAQEGSTLYIRLPGGADPNKNPVRLTRSFRTTFIELENCPYTIFDGIRFRGHGAGRAIGCDEKSHHVWVQNCVVEHGREGFRFSDDSVMVWNQFGYPGFLSFAEDVARMNGGDMSALFEYVKKYNYDDRNKGNALLEGRIASSINSRSAKRLQSANNLCKECFDGYAFGQFEDSTSYRDAAAYPFDDAWELESWNKAHTGQNLRIDRPFVLDAMSGFSHQDVVGQMEGPHEIFNAVVLNKHPLIHPPYVIKNLTRDKGRPPVKVTYANCLLQNMSGPNQWGKDANFIYLDHPKGRQIDLTIEFSILWVDKIDDWDKDWNPRMHANILVSPKDYPHLRGQGGFWVKSIEELHLDENYCATEKSPHWSTDPGEQKIGPLSSFQKDSLHRPLETAFTEELPGYWPVS